MFTAPTKSQLFALTHFAGIEELSGHNAFADATPDMVEAIVDGIAALAEGEWAPLNRIGDEHPAHLVDGKVVFPDGFKSAYDAFVEGGWAGIAAPEEFGGQGMPFSLGMVTLESLGAANMGFNLCPTLSLGAIEAIFAHGTAAQKAAYLPKLATGEWSGTMNLTEPHAGSDVGALSSTAIPRGDGTYNIAGQKIYITFGEHDLADNIVHLVLARTPDAPAGTKGISLFLVPKYRLNADGSLGERNAVVPLKVEHKLGIHSSPTCVLQFGEGGDCIGELVGPEFGGMRAMFTMMNNARINVGLQGVQVAERALQQAMAYAVDRVQSARAGGDPKKPVAIIEHPDVRRMLLRMKAGTDAIRALCYYTAGQVDRAHLGDDAAAKRTDVLVPLTKAYGTDMGVEIASLGVQIHGGMGFIEETGAAQHYRDARIAPIYEGTNGIQAADLVGRKLSMDGGDVMRALISDITADAGEEPALAALAAACGNVAAWMLSTASVDDRLAGSVPFLNMLSVATCGMLMVQQEAAAKAALSAGEGDPLFLNARIVSARFYLEHYVAEALGQKASAMAGADLLYQLDAQGLCA